MVAFIRFFSAILLSTLITKGLTQKCSLDNLNILQARSGRQIGGQPEWDVTVTNNCNCTRSGIVLTCVDFKSAENIDGSLIAPNRDDRCLLNAGKPVKPFESVKFSYAWDPPCVMWPREFNIEGRC